MGEVLRLIMEQMNGMLPVKYRGLILAWAAIIGVVGLFYYGQSHYARTSDIQALKAQVVQQVNSAVEPITQEMQADEATSKRQYANDQRHYMDDLRSQILQDAARCSETKNIEARGLYRQALGDLLQHYESAVGNPYPLAVQC